MRLEGLPDAPRGTVKLIGGGWAAVAGSEFGVWYYLLINDRFCVCKCCENRGWCYHLDAVGEEIRLQQRLAIALEQGLKRQALPDQAELKKLFG